MKAVKYGGYARNIPEKLFFYEEFENALIMPRGFAYQLWQFLSQNGIKPELFDERRVLPEKDFCFDGELRDYQVRACSDVLKRDMALLVAPTGAGKTAMCLWLIAQRKQPALVMVHNKELLFQWIDRIQVFLRIPENEIGIIGAGKFRIGERISVGMVQTLIKRAPEIASYIGYLIADEAHHAPALQFADTIKQFDCKYLTGLTATPFRRDRLSKLIFFHLGDVAGTVDKAELDKNGALCQCFVKQIPTDFKSELCFQDYYSKALSELAKDTERNKLIADIVALDSCSGIKLILSDRVQHLNDLKSLLADRGIVAGVLTGAAKKQDRLLILEHLKAGKLKFLLATFQLISEGFDMPAIESIYLTTPIKFSGRVIQAVGRALRPALGKDKAFVYDFVDVNEPVLSFQADSRVQTYERQGFIFTY